MKTLTDFKKALKPGVLLGTIWHCDTLKNEAGQVTRGADGLPIYQDKILDPAPVSIVQSTQFAVERIKTDGTKANSYCTFPKAADCEIEGDTVTIYENNDRRGRIKILTYTILNTQNN